MTCVSTELVVLMLDSITLWSLRYCGGLGDGIRERKILLRLAGHLREILRRVTEAGQAVPARVFRSVSTLFTSLSVDWKAA